jgi:predicted signal transduction protein with EAL and GGDEF domain
MREIDVLARLGGDEFVILIEHLDADPTLAANQAAIAAEKIRIALNQTYLLKDQDYELTSSIGLTLFGSEMKLNADEILQRADIAMFQAKSAGRNAIQFFDPAMNARVLARSKLENDMRSAISSHQFVLHYQPQVDDASQLRGAEALIRWHHPTRGMMHPAEFIPLAEETGLILPLGLWVMEGACKQLALWATMRHMQTLTIAVNVSARQFWQASFVGDVLAVIDRTGARPAQLKLELTEGLLLENIDETVEKMTELRGIGVTFSLDDFGTGYSSLSYLKLLPLAQLKIDQSFIKDVLCNHNDAAIAKMVITLAGSFGLEVIAEGVETCEQRDFLSLQGCHQYQGYFFGHPIPVDEFEELSFT